MKTISVVMCTYNGAEFIREQLDSIINQTYPIHELIVQDDCSTDETVAIVKEYMETYSFIKLYVNEHNLGFNQNFKSATMKATGDYVAISDQDDVWFPEKLEKQVQAIGNHDICSSNFLWGYTQTQANLYNMECNLERLLFVSTVSGHTMLCQRTFIQTESNWISSIWYDWSLSLHASLQHGIIKIDEPLNYHRRHDKEVSAIEYAKFNGTNRPKVWEPYIRGFRKYRTLQNTPNRKAIYTYLLKQTSSEHFPLTHRLCELLLKEDIISILRLCRLCQKNRHSIYWKEIKGVKGWIRGFFIPVIHVCSPIPFVLYKDLSVVNS